MYQFTLYDLSDVAFEAYKKSFEMHMIENIEKKNRTVSWFEYIYKFQDGLSIHEFVAKNMDDSKRQQGILQQRDVRKTD